MGQNTINIAHFSHKNIFHVEIQEKENYVYTLFLGQYCAIFVFSNKKDFSVSPIKPNIEKGPSTRYWKQPNCVDLKTV